MKEQYKNLLTELIGFRSISTDIAYQGEIQKTAQWLKNLFEQNKFTAQVVEGYGNPVVIASYIVDPAYKTVLIYGHYDVQPAGKDEGWDSEPFELIEANGRLMGRGAIDNKGQVLVHMINVFEHIKNKTLGYNVKFMIEGNEETGSPNLEKFIGDNLNLLTADFVMISDGEVSGGVPNLEVSFRGGFNSTLTVTVGTQDLHSGLYGSAAPNAVHELSKVIASLYDAECKIAVPGFYKDMMPPDMAVVNANKVIPFSIEEYQRITGRKAMLNQDGYDFYSQTGLLPAIEVSGIQAGYMGQGYRNAIPCKASAKINFRLVKNQDPLHIAEVFRAYIRTVLPAYADFEFEMTDPYDGIIIDTENEYFQGVKNILESIWGAKAILKYNGGGLPITTYFSRLLAVPQVLVPLANEDCNIHGANENFALDYLEKAMNFSRLFLGRQ